MSQQLYTIGKCLFGSTQIESVKSIDFSDGSPLQMFFGDGDIYSQFAWMENIVPATNIVTADLSLAHTLSPADKDTITVEFPQRAAAGGFLTGDTALKVEVTNSVLGQVAPSSSQTGESNLPLNFQALSADGTTSPVTTSLAAASSV